MPVSLLDFLINYLNIILSNLLAMFKVYSIGLCDRLLVEEEKKKGLWDDSEGDASD